MHVDMTFMEALGLVAMLIGSAWGLLKLTAIQFNKGLDARFAAAETLATERSRQQDAKLSHIDSMMSKVQALENEVLKRHADYLEKFCTKTELTRESDDSKHALDQIFTLLREINEKLSNKVSREECAGCKPKGQ